jgi:RNA recognition motif-containing protein
MVNCIPYGMQDHALREMFKRFGTITRSIVKMPPETMTDEGKILRSMGMSQLYGLGFVEYDNEESAAAALAEMNGKKVGNQTLKISYYKK